jgi:hypothetical protein
MILKYLLLYIYSSKSESLQQTCVDVLLGNTYTNYIRHALISLNQDNVFNILSLIHHFTLEAVLISEP